MGMLEMKRNALLMNSAINENMIEFIEEIELDTQANYIDIDVDVSKYKGFIIYAELIHVKASNIWLYYGVNGHAVKYMNQQLSQHDTVPNSANMPAPLIVTSALDGRTLFANFNTALSTLYEDVNSIRISNWINNNKYDVGTKVYVYGLKEDIVFQGGTI